MNRIKELRQAKGWRQQDLADKMNTAKSVISRYESEKLGLDPVLINRLCDLFDVSADYLLCRSDTPQPALSDEDARLLRAYRDADPRDRLFIDHLLGLDLQDAVKEIS